MGDVATPIAAAEAAAAANTEAVGANGRRRNLQSTGPQSQRDSTRIFKPTVEQMLVPGSPEQACLSSVFVAQQAPHRTFLALIEPVSVGSTGDTFAGENGDHSAVIHKCVSAPQCTPKDKHTPRCGTGVDFECCCESDSTTAATGNLACWTKVYTAARCCDLSLGPGGDSSCWHGKYDYTNCCGRRRLIQRAVNASSIGSHRSMQSANPQSQDELTHVFRLRLTAEAPSQQVTPQQPLDSVLGATNCAVALERLTLN
jgi:hypothetical protein